MIDLSRLPSQGLSVATLLRQQKGTRPVPIVFVGGESGKVARVRALLPDATYTDWDRIRSAVRRAVLRPPAGPVLPGMMAAYSGTPLAKKLGIKAGASVALLGAPAGFEQRLSPLPEDVRVSRQAHGQPDLLILFAKSRADLERRLPAVARAVTKGIGLWLAWPKHTSGVTSDLTGRIVQAAGLATGLVDYKICAIDETWSGLLFTRRRAGRASRRP